MLGQAILEKRLEHRSGDMLLTVQAALQDYHVAQERYIPRAELSGTQLITVLADFEYLTELPLNPWTGETWRLDGEEPDHLVYRTDPNFETYSLSTTDPKTGKTLLELDSEANHSLE